MQYLIALAVLLLASLPMRASPLPEPMANRLREAAIPLQAVSVSVIRLRDGKSVLSHRATEPMPPASTIKPLTLAVALQELGPAWRGRTALLSEAPQEGDALKGDLVLRGEANPDFDEAALARMLASLRNRGVRAIEGDLVLDRTFFSPSRADVGLPPFDEAPEFRYNAIPDALPVAMQLAGLEIDTRGGQVATRLHPPLDGVRIDSVLELTDGNCARWDDHWRTPEASDSADGLVIVRLVGKVPRDCTISTRVSLMDRDRFAERLFRATWHGLGGEWRGRAREARAPEGARVLAEHLSRPLSELAFDINKRSDNPVTRLAYLVLGTRGGEGLTTPERADAVVRQWMRARKIDDASLVIDNGSGLSRRERISAEALAQSLIAARADRWAPEFLATFPIVAVDGAMRRRLADSPAASRARIKTGSLRDVWAVAGFVDDARGQPHAVVAMIYRQGARGADARAALDALVDWVARSNATAKSGVASR